jgi:TPR repeat protein
MAQIFSPAAALLALALSVAPAWAAQPSDESEAALRQQVQQAVWPADIVTLSDQYLARYPRSAWSDACVGLRARAGQAMQALDNKEVRLYRSAFVAGAESTALHGEVRQAALGDKSAALRLAHMYLHGEQGVTSDLNRYAGWLQYATMLGNRDASYELAVHYRRQDQPVLASLYETRAIEMGYNPPRWLDHVRK